MGARVAQVRVKALLRRAHGLRALNDYQAAMMDLNQVLSLEPGNADAIGERESLAAELRALQAQYAAQVRVATCALCAVCGLCTGCCAPSSEAVCAV
jgi:hypothetical protein